MIITSISRAILPIAICLLSTFSFAQTVEDEETKLLVLVNQLRTNPKKFLKDVAKPYLVENYLDEENRYVKSLIRDLKRQKKSSPLRTDDFLQRIARNYALDMGETGSYGHVSKKLGTLAKRMRGSGISYYGENCAYGDAYAIDILMQLLIDDGVPSLGHRKNLLNKEYTHVGIAIELHRKYGWNCVMDFGKR